MLGIYYISTPIEDVGQFACLDELYCITLVTAVNMQQTKPVCSISSHPAQQPDVHLDELK